MVSENKELTEEEKEAIRENDRFAFIFMIGSFLLVCVLAFIYLLFDWRVAVGTLLIFLFFDIFCILKILGDILNELKKGNKKNV